MARGRTPHRRRQRRAPSYGPPRSPASLVTMQSRAEIDARLPRYAMTKDARDLWPEGSSSAFRGAQQETARVTGAALAGAWGPIELRLPPATDARVLGIAASAAGMGPLLGLWCETERIATEPPVAALLATHLDHGRRRASRMRHELERLLVPRADRDIEVVVLKGTHTGHRYFPEPGSRPSTDIRSEERRVGKEWSS